MQLALAIILLSLASCFDIKSRSLPRALTYGGATLGLALHSAESLLSLSFAPVLGSLIVGIACFAFAYLLYRMGVWAGGDVKLFAALGFVLPSYGGVMFFPFIVLLMSVAAFIPMAFLIVIKAALFSPAFRAEFRGNSRAWLRNTLLISVALSLLGSMANPGDLLSFIILSFLASSFLSAFGIARKELLRERVPVMGLREGMMPAHHILRSGRALRLLEPKMSDVLSPPAGIIANAHMARGLEKGEIRAIQKSGLKSITIRKSMPFVPLMLLGLILAAFFSRFFIY